MRLFAATATLLVLASTARAEDPPSTPAPVVAPSSPQLILVDVFDTGQALVFDRVERQYHVLAPGSAVQGFRVASVMKHQLELVHPNHPGRHYIVTLPMDRKGRSTAPTKTATPVSPSPSPAVVQAPKTAPASPLAAEPSPPATTTAPAIPAAPAPETTPAPTSPDTGDTPLDPYADAIKLPTKEIKVVPAPPASARPAAPAAKAPTPPPAPKTAPPAAKPAGPITLPRAQLDAALADLEALSADIDLDLARGGVVVTRLRRGSLAHRLGLRTGDVIRSIAGIRTRRLEDGADVYVRLGQVRRFDIAITRAGQKLSLPVVIK